MPFHSQGAPEKTDAEIVAMFTNSAARGSAEYIAQALATMQISEDVGGAPGRKGQFVTGVGSTTAGLIGKGGMFSTKLLGTATAAGPVGWVIAGAGVALSLFGGVFKHHAQAVANEQAIRGSANPAVNEALRQLDAEVRAGRIGKREALDHLSNILAQYLSAVRPITKDGAGKCNAACADSRALKAIVFKRKQEYSRKGFPWALAGAVAAGGFLLTR